MYIEDELWNWIEERAKKAHMAVTIEGAQDIIENVGIWYSLDGIRAEVEDFTMTLEECCNEYWFVIEDNKIYFTNAESFAEDLDEYLGL